MDEIFGTHSVHVIHLDLQLGCEQHIVSCVRLRCALVRFERDPLCGNLA
jgi:hypothetical protein